ncbi:MAG: hypothetical protein ACJASR_001561, partial [Psychroserpens sp.]
SNKNKPRRRINEKKTKKQNQLIYCNAIKSFKKQQTQLASFEQEWVASFHRNIQL